jgi:RNA polymerase sigma-70 factor (ECF subfamily)
MRSPSCTAATSAESDAFLRRRAGPRVAFDLTAETFAQAALSLRRFRDEADGSAAPWLLGIARNVLRRSLARERVETAARRRLGLPLDGYEAEFDEVDERAEAATLRPALHAGMATLPNAQRRALELRVLDELPYDQVASRLGTTEVAARLRVMRALATLSRLLKGASV